MKEISTKHLRIGDTRLHLWKYQYILTLKTGLSYLVNNIIFKEHTSSSRSTRKGNQPMTVSRQRNNHAVQPSTFQLLSRRKTLVLPHQRAKGNLPMTKDIQIKSLPSIYIASPPLTKNILRNTWKVPKFYIVHFFSGPRETTTELKVQKVFIHSYFSSSAKLSFLLM